MKKVTKAVEDDIISLYKKGSSYRNISKRLSCSTGLVYKVLKRNKIEALKQSSGPKVKLSDRKQRILVRKFNEKVFLFASDAQKWFEERYEIEVSTETIRKILKKNGIKCHDKHKKPLLTAVHQKNRLKFAKATVKYTYGDRQKIMFSDESKFNLTGADGNVKVWCMDSMRLKQSNIHAVKKFGGGNVMVWGILTKFGVGKLIRITNRMNSKAYCDVLRDGLIGTLDMYNLDLSSMIFMQDNASCHSSKETKKWISDNNIEILNWPACSPDLNIIENVWGYLEKQIRRRKLSYKNPDEMFQIIQEEWNKIPKSYVEKLYWSMCKRVKEVIKNKGDITKY